MPEATVHGHRVSWREAGPPDADEVLVLLHGIAGSAQTWGDVPERLAAAHPSLRVLAPDMLGHGESAKPRGDYSLGAFASGLRDVLVLLDVPAVTVVGHSLGGGVAMQFAYQFPERTRRLVLVDSGGLGPDVSVVLRAATLPGSEVVLPLLTSRPVLRAGARVAAWGDALARHVPLRLTEGPREVARGFAGLADVEARSAFVHTARSVIDLRGQRIDARDRLYLAEAVPTLIVWGERDHIIPVRHGREAHRLATGSRLEVFPDAGHFPHRDDPARFVATLLDFVAASPPAAPDAADFRSRLLAAGAG